MFPHNYFFTMSINYMGIFLYYFVYFYLDQIVYFYFSIINFFFVTIQNVWFISRFCCFSSFYPVFFIVCLCITYILLNSLKFGFMSRSFKLFNAPIMLISIYSPINYMGKFSYYFVYFYSIIIKRFVYIFIILI